MNFKEMHELTSDPDFRHRVEMALVDESLRIASRRPPATTGDAAVDDVAADEHRAEVTYARSVLDALAMRPGQELRPWFALVAVDVKVETDGTTILDVEITKSIRKVIKSRTRNIFS